MTRRRDVDRQLRTLGEIREVMNSLKTLAYVETQRLGRRLEVQRSVIRTLDRVADDFLSFHPDVLPPTTDFPVAFLVIGSERGFCGDFNKGLLEHLNRLATDPAVPVLAVGRKLVRRMDQDPRLVDTLDGVTVVEEIESLLSRVVRALADLQAQRGMLALSVIFHDPDQDRPVSTALLPPFEEHRARPPRYPHPPLLNLSPEAFFAELVEHYGYAALQDIVFRSLMAENQRRIRHLEGALRHLDDRQAGLRLKSNALRQEEIIEEIEVILLSAESLREPSAPGR